MALHQPNFDHSLAPLLQKIVNLRKENFCSFIQVDHRMGAAFIESLKVEEKSGYFKNVIDSKVYEISACVYSQERWSKTIEVKLYWPESWWQMLKSQYAPKWFLKRWPAMKSKGKTILVHCKVVEMLPTLNKIFPETSGCTFPVLSMETSHSPEDIHCEISIEGED